MSYISIYKPFFVRFKLLGIWLKNVQNKVIFSIICISKVLKVSEYNIYLVDMNQNNIIIFDYKIYTYLFLR